MIKHFQAWLSSKGIQTTKAEIVRFLALNGPQHAASMAFFAMLALVPGILLLASFLADILLEVPIEGTASPLDQILNGLELALPTFKGSVRALVEDLAASQTSMTTVGFVSLLLAAGGAFSALERGINIMLGTQKRRHFIGTRLLLAGMMLGIAMGLFLWRIVTSLAPKIVNAMGVDFPEWLLYNPLTELGIQVGVTATGFYVLIRILATEKFSRVARWTGALVFALLFHVSRVGLDHYLTTTPLQQVYGTAMAFVGLILWLYVSSLLLLISSSVIHAVHVARQPVEKEENIESPGENPASIDPEPGSDSDVV